MSVQKLPNPVVEGPLLAWLFTVLQPMSRSRVKQALQAGQIVVNGKSITQFDHPIGPQDKIVLDTRPKTAPPTGLQIASNSILYEDDALIVLDKPVGLLTVATDEEKIDTAFARLKNSLEIRQAGRPYVVHRLDRETSGVLLFARTPEIRDQLQEKWREVRKTYWAVTEKTPFPLSGEIKSFLCEGKNLRVRSSPTESPEAKWAVTRYRVITPGKNYSLVEVDLDTGRKHQIRVHLSNIKCPIVGDTFYSAKSNPVDRLGLHAWRLAFNHPVTGKPFTIESPLPAKLQKIVG